MENRLVAIIEIGSTGIRLLIAQLKTSQNQNGDEWTVLDRAGRPVAFGRDVFNSGELSRESLLECLTVLSNFNEMLAAWNIAAGDVYVIATSALRAARNRDIFIDRIQQETGFHLTLIDGIEENRLLYLGVRFALKQDLPLFWRANSMIIEVGGGSTELMLLRRGQMVAAHSINMGTIIIDERIRLSAGYSHSYERYLNEPIRTTIGLLNSEMELAHIRTIVIGGSDAQLASVHAGRELNDHCRIINRNDFIDFAEKVRNFSIEECIKKLGISYNEAEGFIPGILILKLFLENSGAAQLIVPLISIREGYLIDLAQGGKSRPQDEFYSQIIASAVNLGRKYHFDEAHSKHVANLCLVLFDSLVKEHGMNHRHRMMLEASAILHDIGTFLKASGHNKHGQYIVLNSEIFGLHRDELEIIANVIRYHRGDSPAQSDIEYMSLQREERILVLKMTAILRIANALDKSHSQHIRSIKVIRRAQTIDLQTQGIHDIVYDIKTPSIGIVTELIDIEEKSKLFQDVFGYKVVLS